MTALYYRGRNSLRIVLHTHAVQTVQVRLKLVSNEGTFLLRSKQFLIYISPRVAAGSLSNTTWYTLRMR
jgi:hypothetical protein